MEVSSPSTSPSPISKSTTQVLKPGKEGRVDKPSRAPKKEEKSIGSSTDDDMKPIIPESSIGKNKMSSDAVPVPAGSGSEVTRIRGVNEDDNDFRSHENDTHSQDHTHTDSDSDVIFTPDGTVKHVFVKGTK